MEDKKQAIINEYFALTGDKLTNDDPIVTLMLYFNSKAESALSNNPLNENLTKTLHEINETNVSLKKISAELESIQLNRLQIVNELSALNKAQIYKEIKENIIKDLKENKNTKPNNIYLWISLISTSISFILALKLVFWG
ncbi:hypothetical protein [Acinetobacter pittii]|uniref:Uncharacterized protein n=1 Tax=Acinetobacter pittii TaxID=48296 RepID=A0A6H0G0A7_ACIPI|nr:hypothetical protein [Acinetobacter pittii]QIT20014.1 hypothetical protein G8E09_19585 [Acinetobacter pittii]